MTQSGKVYLCSSGETFDSVSLFLYGSEAYTPELLSANPFLVDRSVFLGGEELIIPVVTVSEDRLDEDRMPSRAPWAEA